MGVQEFGPAHPGVNHPIVSALFCTGTGKGSSWDQQDSPSPSAVLGLLRLRQDVGRDSEARVVTRGGCAQTPPRCRGSTYGRTHPAPGTSMPWHRTGQRHSPSQPGPPAPARPPEAPPCPRPGTEWDTGMTPSSLPQGKLEFSLPTAPVLLDPVSQPRNTAQSTPHLLPPPHCSSSQQEEEEEEEETGGCQKRGSSRLPGSLTSTSCWWWLVASWERVKPQGEETAEKFLPGRVMVSLPGKMEAEPLGA